MTEDERSNKYWEILTNHLRKATPVEQVHFARWTNYSDKDILRWIINRPETDVVAAMTIYFQSSPDYYAGISLEDIDSHDIDEIRFLETISDRVKQGFYTDSNISFKGSDFLDNNYDFKNSKREIPHHMQIERIGSIDIPYDLPENFDEGLPNLVSEEVWELFNTTISE